MPGTAIVHLFSKLRDIDRNLGTPGAAIVHCCQILGTSTRSFLRDGDICRKNWRLYTWIMIYFITGTKPRFSPQRVFTWAPSLIQSHESIAPSSEASTVIFHHIVALFNVYSCAVNSLSKCRHHSHGLYRCFLTSLRDAVPSTSPASQAPSSLSAILYRIELTLSNIFRDAKPDRSPAYQAPSNPSES